MIGGIGNWLKKRVDDVQGAFGVSNTAQTFKTNTPKAAPARTISRQPQPQQFSQPAQTNKITNDVNSVMQPRFNLNQSLQNNGVNTQPKVQQPKTTQQLVNDSYGSGFSGLINRGKDILDANTEADRIKRQAQSGLNETYEQQQTRLTNAATSAQSSRGVGQQGAASFGREAVDFIGKAPGAIGNIGGSIMQSKNPVVKTLRSAVPVLNAASVADAQTGGAGGREVQRMSNNANKFIDNKVGQSRFGERQGENKWAVGGGQMAAQLPLQIATGGAGLVSTGARMASDEYNKARAAGKSNDAALGIGLLQGGASALSEMVSVDRFLPGNNVAGSSLVRAAKRFLTEGTQEAQQQFTQNLITNKTYNPNQSLREGIGESFLLGGAVGGATSGLLDAPDVFNNRTTLNEGGYIAGPLALDFSKAQAEGKVFEGVDGKPRFEVDDSGAKIKNPNGKTLGELLDHPKLFEQYDSLKNLPVKTFTDSDSRLSGAYDYENKSMELNLADRNPLGALLHELQHAVQDIEGTATGTSLYRAGEYRNKKLREHNSNLTTEETYKRQEKINQEVDAVKAARRKEGSPLSHDETTALYTKLRNKYFGRPSKYGKLTDFDVYERHAGEAEARAVEARMNMPMSERYVEPDGRTLYHGSPVADTIKQEGFKSGKGNALLGEGVYLTPSRDKAGNYTIPRDYDYSKPITEEMRNKGIIEAKIPQNAKIFTPKTRAELKTPDTNYGDPKLITEKFKKLGYDGIELNGEVVIFDPSKVSVAGKPRSTFYDSLDVPKEDLIIRNGDGKAMSIDDPLAALKQEANQLKTPRGNLQDALQPDTAYSDMLRGIEAQTQQPQVFDPELKKLERQKQQIIDAEARAKYEASKQLAQDQKDLRKTIRASGGIGSSDYETLPSGLKRKNGRALDDLATELGFESDQALVDELTTHTQPERLKDLREVVEHEMKNGKSELSGDYKNLLKAIDDRHAELLRYPEGAKVVKNTQEFPSLDEFNSLLSTPEAQSNSNKTKQAVSAATADLRKQQFDAVVKGDLDTADQVRKKIGEIETGLKRTAPEVKREVETVQPVIKSIKDKAVREKFVAATKGYLGTKNSNKIERQVAIRDLENKYKLSEAEKLNAIQALDSSTVKPANDNVANYVKEFRSLTDSAYKQYRESGVNMGYQSSYLPRIYQNPETGQMYDSAEFELLQRGSKRMKGREADKVNTDWLVERDPTKLLERYYDSMDKVAAGQKYMKELQNAGLITASTEPVPGLRPIVAEGMQNESGMTYYAPKQVADKLNTMFGSKETTNLVEKVMEKGSGINSLFQGFVLSGGIPNTPVNSFGMMQVMKEAMTLHPVKAGRAIHAGFSKKFADKYFTSRKDMIKLMAENDVDIRIDLSETGKSGWQRTKEAWSDSKAKGLNRGWDEITNDSTFKRFMPMLEVVHFENMYKKAYKKTGSETDAARIAAESVKNFYGKTGEYKQAVRSKLSNDSMGAVLFAPRFRESMVNFWGKNIKALNPKNMTKLEYRDNIKFLVASGITFAAMNSLNEALNGVNMWDNPDDKKDKLIIPSEKLKQLGINTNGKDVGVPFLSSIATVPRNAISGAASFVTGDLESAGKRAKSFLSMPLSSAGDLIANEDYFGNRIVKDDVKGLDRFTQMGAYTAGRNMQPWLREGLNKFGTKLPDDLKKRLGVKEKGGFETAANALESPLRFYNPEYYKYRGKWAPRGDGVKYDNVAEQRAASLSQTNDTTAKSSRTKIAGSLNSEYKKILTRYNDMSSEDREKLFFSENAAEYQYSLARYENDLAKGTLSVADKVVRKKSVAKAEVGSKFSKDTRESYDKLTKAELQNLTNNDPDGKRIWEDAVAYGDALVAAGIIKKNKLKTGSASGGSKKKGGSSRKGLVSNYKSSDTSAISKKLQQLAFGSSKSKSGSSAPKKHAAKLKGVRSA